MRIFHLFVLALAISASCGRSHVSTLTTADVISWLPPDIETLVVANGAISLSATSEGSIDVANAIAQAVATGPLDERAGRIVQGLDGARVKFAVEGARAFRSPAGLGLAPYEGSHILVIDEDADPSLLDILRRLRESGGSSVKVSDEDVIHLTWRAEHDDWSAFVARPRPGVLVSATTEGMLRETLAGMRTTRAVGAMPPDLLEWSVVDTTAPVWGVRHYRRGHQRDPSWPVDAVNERDEMAIGITFSVSGSRGNAFVAHYLSQSRDAEAIARRVWWQPAEGLAPAITASPGAVRISAQPESAEAASILKFVLLGVLGHAVFL
jgi:hypothetical protein